MKITKNSGFSLIELIIVIALLAIVLAIAAPNFSAYRDRTNLREAARDIASDIYLYKQRAISENVRYRITFDVTANNYTIARESVLNLGDFVTVITKKVGAGHALVTMVAAPSFDGTGASMLILPRGTFGDGSLRLQHPRISTILKITTTTMGKVHVDKEVD